MPKVTWQGKGMVEASSSSSSKAGALARLLDAERTKNGQLTTAGQALLSALQPLLAASSSSSSIEGHGMPSEERLRLQQAAQLMAQVIEACAAGHAPETEVDTEVDMESRSSQAGLCPPSEEELQSAVSIISTCVTSHMAATATNALPSAAAGAADVESSSSSSTSMAAMGQCRLCVLKPGVQQLPAATAGAPAV
jgi:hypothetical protein